MNKARLAAGLALRLKCYGQADILAKIEILIRTL